MKTKQIIVRGAMVINEKEEYVLKEENKNVESRRYVPIMEIKILQNELQNDMMTEEEIVFWISRFMGCDVTWQNLSARNHQCLCKLHKEARHDKKNAEKTD